MVRRPWSLLVLVMALLVVGGGAAPTTARGAGWPVELPGLRPTELTRVGRTLFFTGCTEAAGCELWKSDGTARGTRMVADIRQAPPLISSDPRALVAVGGRLFFLAWDDTHGESLWTSDGTAAGTRMVRDIHPGTGSPFINWADGSKHLTAVGGRVFFAARDGRNGVELWVSDGTEAGTHMVREATRGGSSWPALITRVDDRVFYRANGDELWVSDGTPSGTRLVRRFPFGVLHRPENLAAFRGRLFIGGTRRLWRSDGTASGTVVVREFARTHCCDRPTNLTVAAGRLWFSAQTPRSGTELWVSDGMAVGTRMVRDLAPGRAGSRPGAVVELDGRVLVAAEASSAEPTLWRSDGTRAGTVRLRTRGLTEFVHIGPLVRVGRQVLFPILRYRFPRPDRLWRTDGTSAGTGRVTSVWTVPYGEETWAVTMRGVLYFVNADPGTGPELWRSDGTATGTFVVKDVR